MEYYYNENEHGLVRANLVYTPLVDKKKNVMCMSFNRDLHYHFDPNQNALWTDLDLQNRFEKELEYHKKVQKLLPTLEIYDVDYDNRKIYMEWPSDDFYMLGRNESWDRLLPDWKEQWLHIVKTLKHGAKISKFSLHPNSFVIRNQRLIPFNWFFCYDRDEPTNLSGVIKQISIERFDKLKPILDKYKIGIDEIRPAKDFEHLCLMSFSSNYPEDLIEQAISS